MSLSLGSGPLTRDPAGAFNFDLDEAAPAHRIYFADFLPRVRARVGEVTVLDTTRAKLLYESGIPPRLYAPLDDYAADALVRTDHTTHCPFKGDASYWTVAGRENASWGYESPIESAPWLAGYAALYPDAVDTWLVEEEEVVGHLRDPFHRVDVHPSSRRVRILAGDDVIADTDRAVLLFETGLPPRAYIAPRDVRAAIEPSATRTVCPHKGEASHWTVAGVEDAAWSYEYPRHEAYGIAGLVAFYPDRVTVEIASS
jgi:uncharacterized protein (DUF427 family)